MRTISKNDIKKPAPAPAPKKPEAKPAVAPTNNIGKLADSVAQMAKQTATAVQTIAQGHKEVADRLSKLETRRDPPKELTFDVVRDSNGLTRQIKVTRD